MALPDDHSAATIGSLPPLREHFRPVAPAIVALLTAGVVVAFVDSTPLRLVAIAAAAVPLVAIEITALKRALLALAILEIPLQADIWLRSDQSVSGNVVNGFNLSLTTLILLGLYLLWLAEAFALPQTRDRSRRPMTIRAAATYLLLVVVSAPFAQELTLSLFEITLLVQTLLLLIYVVHFIRDSSDLFFVVVMLTVGLILQGLIALVVYVGRIETQVGPIIFDIDGGRVAGTLGHPNKLGSYVTLVALPAAGLALSSAPRPYRWLGGSAALLGLLALVLSGSRGAWVGFAAGLLVFVVLAFRRGWLSGRTIALALGMGGTLLFGLQGILAERLILNPAAFARLPLNGLAWQMFQEQPLLGVGANNFIAASSEFLTVDWTRVWLHTVHNKYLLVMAETGILGFAAFGWFLSSAVLGGWRGYRLGDSVIGPLALGFTAGLVGNMVHMFADVFHGRPDTVMLWLVVGVIVALEARFLSLRAAPTFRRSPIHARH